MRSYRLDHLSNRDLLSTLATDVAQERTATAQVIADLAEVETRRLHLAAGYTSMSAFCVDELGYAEHAAYKRIQAARLARNFPAIFPAVAERRLHLTGVLLLGPYLTHENAAALIDVAAGKSKAQIEELLAQRFPQTETLPLVEALPTHSLAPERADSRPEHVSDPVSAARTRLAPEGVGPASQPGAVRTSLPTEPPPAQHIAAAAQRSTVKPHAPQRYALHLTIDQSTYENLQCASELLSHSIPSGDLAQVIARALAILVAKLKKQKCHGHGQAASNSIAPSDRKALRPRARRARGLGA